MVTVIAFGGGSESAVDLGPFANTPSPGVSAGVFLLDRLSIDLCRL
jgi:hypothetical protein